LIDAKDDGCGDADCGHEGVGASVITGVNASPVFEPDEHNFYFVSLSVEDRVVRDMD
jgi:hypothetical protein